MKTTVPYGSSVLDCEVPDEYLLGIAVPSRLNIDQVDEIAELKRAMQEPIGTSRLSNLAKPGQKVAIIISDYTRPTPSAKILPVILEELTESGIRYKDVVVIAAAGTHRPTTDEELRKMVGDNIMDKVRVISHDCDKDEDMVYIGKTKNGTPLVINKNVAEADIKISVSCIEPHHNAGWSGGSKNILPGVSSRATVFHHHAQATHPGVELGVIKGNPFREDLDEAGRMAGVDFIVNCFLDAKGRILKAFAGDLIEAHRAGVNFIMDLMSFPIPHRPNIVIASPGGAPRDQNLWQAEGKCLTRVSGVVADRGIVILVAKCDEGIGHKDFAAALTQSAEEIINKFSSEKFSVMGNKAFRLAKLVTKAKLFVVSELTKEHLPQLPIKYFTSVQDALDVAIKEVEKPSVLVVPYATQVVIKTGDTKEA